MLVVTVGAVQQELHNTFSKSTDCVRKSIRHRENWITNVWIVLVIFFRTKNLGKNISLPKTKFVLKNLIFHDGGPCYIGQLFRRSMVYRNQSIDLLCKSVDQFLYERGLSHERVKLSKNIMLSILWSILEM